MEILDKRKKAKVKLAKSRNGGNDLPGYPSSSKFNTSQLRQTVR